MSNTLIRLDNLTKVSANIDTNCTPDQLVQFLAAIENYPQFLTVDELNIMTIRLQKKSEIRPNITVAGYIAAPPESKTEKPAR